MGFTEPVSPVASADRENQQLSENGLGWQWPPKRETKHQYFDLIQVTELESRENQAYAWVFIVEPKVSPLGVS